jgi:predicted TIM-barrel fold metal-dependent hydrolase
MDVDTAHDGSWPKDLNIIDAHHHLWDLENNRYPWLQQEPPPKLVCGDTTPIRRSYHVADLKTDVGDLPLIGTVHLQCDWDPNDPCGETRWLDAQAQQHGLPSAIVAFAALQDDDVEGVLDRHLELSTRVRGIRQILNWHEDEVLTFGAPKGLMQTSEWRQGFAALMRRNLSFDLQIYPHQMGEAASLAGDFPETQIIINHGGMPVDRSQDGMSQWRAGLKALAAHDNVAIKISGLGMVDHRWTNESIKPLVLQLIDIFGSKRTMFASNFPVDKLYSNYADIWHAFLQITSAFPIGERRDLFSANAERIYRIMM